MALPDSAGNPAISFTAIFTEFGGTSPHALSEYYRDGAYADGIDIPAGETRIPASGIIKFSDFYGTSAAAPSPSYTLTPSTTTPNEGDAVTFTFGGSNLVDTTVYFAITHGTTNDSDFTAAPPTSTRTAVTITSGVYSPANVVLTLDNDLLQETGSETFEAFVYDAASGGTQLAASGTITVADTSQDPVSLPGTPPNISISSGTSGHRIAGWRFTEDGRIQQVLDQYTAADPDTSLFANIGNWYTPTTAGIGATGYQIRATSFTGDGITNYGGSPAYDVWYDLDTTPTWYLTVPDPGTLFSGSAVFEIRNPLGITVASQTFSSSVSGDNP